MNGPGADGWGITNGYWGTDGAWHETGDATRRALRQAMGGMPDAARPPEGPPVWTVPAGWSEPLLGPCHLVLEDGRQEGVVTSLSPDLPIGRHRLVPTDGGPTTLLIVRPRRCHLPADLRASALAVQLYAARSRDSWGIGDLGDLATLGSWARGAGVDLVATSPLHAASPGDDPQPSPYYPSSRRHLHPLHLRVEDVPGARVSGRVAELAAEAARHNDVRLIDRRSAWQHKRAALEILFEGRGTAIDRSVQDFRTDRGTDLERWATFCAIAETHPGSWQHWPSELRHPSAPAVARFASAHAERIRFHCWLQWLADQQLSRAADACPLITDLAVGVDPGGADAWADQDLLALDARVGAPPDDFATAGQDWGLPPPVPHRLREDHYDTFARTLRANLRHAAGVRIDHILGLFRLYWIPGGHDARQGAYVRLPAEDLLAVTAIESVRAGAFVIGEDLGTVEDGVRDALANNAVLGTQVLWFEETPPQKWRTAAQGAATTHDLPTIVGLWSGADRDARAAAGLEPQDTDAALARLQAVVAAEDADPTRVVSDAHRAIAESPVAVATATLDDVLEVADRPNMPGTVDEWPNWRLALPTLLDDLTSGPTPPTLEALVRPRTARAHPDGR